MSDPLTAVAMVSILGTAYSVAQVAATIGTLAELARNGLSALRGNRPVEEAIKRTASAFDAIDGVDKALHDWLSDAETVGDLAAICVSPSPDDVRKHANDLVERAGHHIGRGGAHHAEAVVRRFLREYTAAVLRSEPALQVHHTVDVGLHAQTQQLMRTGFHNLAEQISGVSAPDRTGAIGAHIATAEDLLRKHKYKAAAAIYEHIVDSAEASQVQRYEALLGVAKCLRRTGDLAGSAKYYRRASDIAPTEPDRHLALARANLAGESYDQALEEASMALDDPSLGRDAALLLAEAHLLKENPEDAVAAVLDPDGRFRNHRLDGDVRTYLLLGYAHFRMFKAKEARTWAQRGLEIEPDNVDLKELNATSTIPMIAEHRLTPRTLDTDGTTLATKAEEELTGVIGVLKSSDYVPRLRAATVNRAAVRVYMGRASEAVEDCVRVIAEDPDVPEAYANLVRGRCIIGDLEGAIDAYKTGTGHGLLPEAVLPELIYALLGHRKAAEAAALLPDLDLRADMPEDILMAAADACSEAGLTARAQEYVEALGRKLGDDARVWVSRATLLRKTHDTSGAEAALLHAIACPASNFTQIAHARLAVLYDEQKRYDDAIVHFALATDKHRDDALLKDYVRCLYMATDKSKCIPECLDICRIQRKENGPSEYYLWYEAQIAEHLNQLAEAQKLYERLAALVPDSTGPAIRLSSVMFRRGRRDDSLELLTRLAERDVKEPRDLVMISQGLAACGSAETALKLAYRAVEVGFLDSDTHKWYVQLVLTKEPALARLLDLNESAEGAAVSADVDGKEMTWLLVRHEPTNPVLHELHIDTVLGKSLLGKRVGETFVYSDPTGDRTAKITKVSSKYVYVWLLILEHFNEWFADKGFLGRIPVDTESPRPPERLIELIQKTDITFRRALDDYSSNVLPVALVGKMIGRSHLDGRDLLVSIRDGVLLCSHGTEREQQSMERLLTAGQGAVIDLTALASIIDLNMSDVVKSAVGRVACPQSLLDELVSAIIAMPDARKPDAGADTKTKELMEAERAAAVARIQRLERMRDFIATSCEIVGSTPPTPQELLVTKALGSANMDALHHAREHGLPLLSDDLRLREFARVQYNVGGIHVPAVLTHAAARGLMSESDTASCLAKLVLMNYVRVSITGVVLAEALALVGGVFTPPIVRVLQDMTLAIRPTDNVVAFFADFVKQGWLTPATTLRRLSMVQAATRALRARDPNPSTLSSLLQQVRGRFHLMQHALPGVLRDIELCWKSAGA